ARGGWIAGGLGRALGAVGWVPAPGEADDVRLRRSALLRLVGGVAEAPDVLAESRRRFDAYLADRGSLEPNLADTVVALAARLGDATLYERYRAVAADARTPQEQRRFLLNLASFRRRESIDRTLAALLTAQIPTQGGPLLLRGMLGTRRGGEEAWGSRRRRWTALRKRTPPLMLARLVEATPALRTARHASEVRAFFRSHPLPEASRALRQAL